MKLKIELLGVHERLRTTPPLYADAVEYLCLNYISAAFFIVHHQRRTKQDVNCLLFFPNSFFSRASLLALLADARCQITQRGVLISYGFFAGPARRREAPSNRFAF